MALGAGGFADDTAPRDALVALRASDGTWHVADDLATARRLAGTVQGRKSTVAVDWPLPVVDGEWARTLCTTWVEPAYVEPDAAWCEPGGAYALRPMQLPAQVRLHAVTSGLLGHQACGRPTAAGARLPLQLLLPELACVGQAQPSQRSGSPGHA